MNMNPFLIAALILFVVETVRAKSILAAGLACYVAGRLFF